MPVHSGRGPWLVRTGAGAAGPASRRSGQALVGQPLLHRAFVQRLAQPRVTRAPLPDIEPVARLSVTRLGVREIVVAGATKHALSVGPSIVTPARPGARNRVTVIAGHRDTHFRFIRDLKAGDVVTLRTAVGRVQRYRVSSFQTVRWDSFAVPSDPARPLLALATCYPFEGKGGGPLRRVAWAEAIR